uniref:ABC transporter domain-containing protein n=1 Tax=Cannabis sativa TaxID=3483 RepID=A0A803PTY6_CANSA
MESQSHSPPLPSPPVKTYELTASSISYTKSTTGTITSLPPLDLIFKSCTKTPPTHILRDISFTATHSEILAVVGPSGAGKSTLLDILAARTSPTKGTLFLNSSPLNPSSFRKLSCYVPQHDACLPLLTVSETFAFAARLLFPKTTDVNDIISSILTDLKLSHLADVLLGHGLSGGERRRVSIGLSLLHDPAVLILDEPTSGLDSTSAFNVMQILKSICVSRYRTVVLSIHQPSFKILSSIDKILLLSKGSVVHHGTLSSLQSFLLSNGYFISQESMPKYWLFMHFFSMYKYALDALLINEYGCLVSTCLMWYEEDKKECMVTGADVLQQRGLDERQRRVSRSKK